MKLLFELYCATSLRKNRNFWKIFFHFFFWFCWSLEDNCSFFPNHTNGVRYYGALECFKTCMIGRLSIVGNGITYVLPRTFFDDFVVRFFFLHCIQETKRKKVCVGGFHTIGFCLSFLVIDLRSSVEAALSAPLSTTITIASITVDFLLMLM